MFEGGRDVVAQRRLKGFPILRKAAQEREYARVLLLARDMEDEEDCARGVVRPICSAGEVLQQIEQSGGDLIPVVEGPLHGVSRRIMTGTREGLDRGLDVHGDPPSVLTEVGAAGLRTHAQLRATCGVLWRAWSDGVVP